VVPVLVAGRNPVGFRQQRLGPLIWAVAEPAGEPGRVTAAVLRASVRHTDALSWGLAKGETAVLWQQPAVAKAARGFELVNSRVSDALRRMVTATSRS